MRKIKTIKIVILIIFSGILLYLIIGHVFGIKEKTINAGLLTVQTIEGNRVTINLNDGHPKFINIWASWCEPCKEEVPIIKKLFKKYKNDVDFYAINATKKDSIYNVINFKMSNNMDFPVFLDIKGEAANLFHIATLPTSIIVDQKGTTNFFYGVLPLETWESKFDKLLDIK